MATERKFVPSNYFLSYKKLLAIYLHRKKHSWKLNWFSKSTVVIHSQFSMLKVSIAKLNNISDLLNHQIFLVEFYNKL